jgi:hypothetical protein
MFIPESCMMSKTYAVCQRLLRPAFAESRILNKRTAYRLAARIRDASSTRDKNPSSQLLSLTQIWPILVCDELSRSENPPKTGLSYSKFVEVCQMPETCAISERYCA